MTSFETYISPLYMSSICRICANDYSEGIYLYDFNDGMDLKSAINRYLPLKVEDDGKLPRTICNACHIQLASTVQFFDLIINGQAKLRDLWTQEVALSKQFEKEKEMFVRALDGEGKISLVTDETRVDNELLISIFNDGPLFGEEHELTLLVEGLEKPKRKRGRPRKPKPEVDTSSKLALEASSDLEEARDEEDLGDESGRRRRKRKLPWRFKEAVAGKEMERVLVEEGALLGDESDFEAGDVPVSDKPENSEALPDADTSAPEVIGHLQTPSGETEPILAYSHGRRRKKPSRFVCDFCHVSFKDRTRWIKHRNTHKGLRFQCSEVSCLDLFTSRTKLRIHQEATEHTGVEIVAVEHEEEAETEVEAEALICERCGVERDSAEGLALHVMEEHSLEAGQSASGVKVSENSQESMVGELELEIKKIKQSEDVISCKEEVGVEAGDVAGEYTETKDENETSVNSTAEATFEEINEEIIQDSNGKKRRVFKCKICGKEFQHNSSLIYHKEGTHNNGVKFQCSKCPKLFTHRQLLKKHQLVHSDLRPYSCSTCNATFKTRSNLFNHAVVHTGEKRFPCTICNQTFTHKTSQKLHLAWHNGIRPFKCEVCSKTFTQSGNLNEHMRIHYGEKPHKCSYCTKCFTTSSQLKMHIRRHTGERPWKCQYCDKQFLQKAALTTHVRRHTGEKPFHCNYCEKPFTEHWSLRKHIRLHTGERPYKCEKCGKGFADCSNLSKHRKVHGKPFRLGQFFYVLKPDVEDQSQSQTFVLDSQSPEEEIQEYQGTGQVTVFEDEEGNPYRMHLPDGRYVEVLSLDAETNIVQCRTNDGRNFLVKFSEKENLTNENLLENIRKAVLDAQPMSVTKVTEDLEPEHSLDTALEAEDNSVTTVLVPQQSSISSKESSSGQKVYSIRLDKEEAQAEGFATDSLRHVYLIAEQ